MQDRIALLLPYKENFSNDNFGSVSLFVNDLNKSSKYRNLLDIYGNTDLSPIKGFNYFNLENSLMHRLGRNKYHTKLFIKKIKFNNNIKLIEIHNRPLSVITVKKELPQMKIIFYYHNDPLSMKGYVSSEKRKKILDSCEIIYFVSNYLKKQFLNDLKISSNDNKKLLTLYNGSHPEKKINAKKKKNIVFVGRLEKNKGFFLFLDAAYKILKEFPEWRVDIFGSSNKGIVFESKSSNLKYYGHIKNTEVLKYLSKSSISVIPAIWNEPFGRTLVESVNAGCAVISSQKGGLSEISKYFKLVKLRNPSKITIYNALKKLIMSPDEIQMFQSNSIKNTPFNLKNITNHHDKKRSLFVSK